MKKLRKPSRNLTNVEGNIYNRLGEELSKLSIKTRLHILSIICEELEEINEVMDKLNELKQIEL